MTSAPRLPAYAVFAAMIAAAGLPLYMHAPKFFVDEYGVSLAALGSVLFCLRLLDVVQDPLLGHVADRLRRHRAITVIVAGSMMAVGMFGLFAVAPPVAPLVWFGIMLTLVFSAFSYLTICFYAQGVAAASEMPGDGGHLTIARWRETGALLGICAAAVAPVALGGYTGFAIAFVFLSIIALWAMRTEWKAIKTPGTGISPVLRDTIARRLLLVALANSAPVAVSSTLFLFFVEDRLDLPGWEGPFLLMFFLSAALAAPVWGQAAERFGTRPVLVTGMVLSIVSFAFAIFLGSGDGIAFGIICVASGIALGADMTLLPALFAARMQQVSPGAAEGFSLWSFVSKITLAIAAVSLLPLLEAGGYRSGQDNAEAELWLLSLLYGAVPCVLKVIAIGVLVTTPTDRIAAPAHSLKERSAT
ncbi:MFS transporter [Roseovarius aestuariivivens]|uniref:MFS transporter n=1 Tax=Roseovarius aestuariivivens TaxID=1888910 RepID=UPI001080DE55|nr:MFS transporter [Roseovarius aestuariivivens]